MLALGVTLPAAVASYTVVHPARAAVVDAAGLGERVTIPVGDDLRLIGRWRQVNRPQGTIVLLHGYGTNKTQMLPIAHFLNQAGFNTLAYDARAHGESGGALTTVGGLETADLGRVLDWLGQRGISSRIGAFGYSMGAATAVLRAAQDPRLQAVATEGCFSTLNDLLAVAFPVFFHLPSWPYAPVAVRMAEWQAGFSAANVRPVDAVGRLGLRPMLIMGGMADTIATPAQTLALAQQAHHPQLWLIPNARHVEGFETSPQAYTRRVVDFFRAGLASAFAQLPAVASAQG